MSWTLVHESSCRQNVFLWCVVCRLDGHASYSLCVDPSAPDLEEARSRCLGATARESAPPALIDGARCFSLF